MQKKSYEDIGLGDFHRLKHGPLTQVVDVREDWEFEEFNEGGINIPLASIRDKRHLLEPFETLIVICTNGVRSRVAAMDYCRIPEWHAKKILHLKGGILEAE